MKRYIYGIAIRFCTKLQLKISLQAREIIVWPEAVCEAIVKEV